MKIKSLLLGILTCGALVACSNEDIVEPINGDQTVPQGEYYVAVNFTMSGNTSSRAFGDGGFDAGTADEVTVKKAIFFFLDADGRACADPSVIGNGTETVLNNWVDGTGSVDKKSGKVIVMKNPTSVPASIVAILNPTADLTGRKSLADLKKITEDYANAELTTTGKFVMSNSVYMDGNGNEIIGTPVKKENLYEVSSETTPTDNDILAAITPVTIPVEKVVAKVNVTETAGLQGEVNEKVDGSDKNITVKVAGWWLDNTNPESYLIKHINTSWTGTWWNDAANSRSYWAVPSNGTLEHQAYSTNKTDIYCQENTDQTNHTQLVVAAKLLIDNQPATLVKWRGNMYTENGFKTEFANLAEVQQYYYCTNPEAGAGVDKEYATITTAHLDFAFNTNDEDLGIADYEAVVNLKANAPAIYTIANKVATEVTPATVNATLKGLAKVQLWKDGQTYFYTSINHNADSEYAKYGIIRNHLYKLTLNSIAGLGTPVPNGDKVIIPGRVPTETEYSYIAAEVEILKYKVITQGVDLQ